MAFFFYHTIISVIQVGSTVGTNWLEVVGSDCPGSLSKNAVAAVTVWMESGFTLPSNGFLRYCLSVSRSPCTILFPRKCQQRDAGKLLERY